MSVKPIIYSGESIPALIRGEKTQTRRLSGLREINADPSQWTTGKPARDDDHVRFFSESGGLWWIDIKPPYAVGDVLYPREAWRLARVNGQQGGSAEFCTIQFRADYRVLDYRPDWRDHYADLIASEKVWKASEAGNLWGRWRPSIHLRREHSRLTLPRVTEVRAERVQEITEADARAEGVAKPNWPYCFAKRWDSIHAKRGHGWDANPWVWVIRHEPAVLENVDDFLRRAAA